MTAIAITGIAAERRYMSIITLLFVFLLLLGVAKFLFAAGVRTVTEGVLSLAFNAAWAVMGTMVFHHYFM